MWMVELQLLPANRLNKSVNEDFNANENSMIGNIYSYCRNNQFDKAVFMCGVAHRKSIIEKINSYRSDEEFDIRWVTYGN